ncbi:MAG: Nif3-like dinuclear metal center hexameric protein [Gammaproteobacteria bacterium]
MMVTQKVLTTYLSELLQPQRYRDYCPNGLQVTGAETIHGIVTGVTICEALIKAAIAAKAHAIIVHHGLFWHKDDPSIVGMKHRRLKALLDNNINVYGYHLPLDGHDGLGNNVEFARLLTIEEVKPLTIQPYDPPLILQGQWNYELKEAAIHIEKLLQRRPLVIAGGDHRIKKIAWCTGAAQDGIDAAASAGMDAYISGEVSERTFHMAKELGIHYIAAGHHATERYGVRALGEHLAQRFHVEHQFIDIPNPV